MSSRLALGTVQFGLPYGVANRVGQVSRSEASAILNYARERGSDTLDTAMGYGESEERLGQIGVRAWRVVTKLPPLPDPCKNVGRWMQEALADSLKKLRLERVHGLLLHQSAQLAGTQGEALYEALARVKAQGLVEKVGVSIYGPAELEALWPRFHLDLVQAPFNVLDRRLSDSGWLHRLHEAGTEIHARSLFLQGLLLMDAASRPPSFNRWQPLWNRWHEWLAGQKLTALQAAVSFALSRSEIDRFVVGVDSLQHLEDIFAAENHAPVEFPQALQSEDSALINPSEWNNL